MSPELAKSYLGTFMTSKYKIMLKLTNPEVKGFELTDRLAINDAFTNSLKRVALPTPVLDEVIKKERVTEDRSVTIDACIVRLMKSRKVMSHTDLVQGIMQNLIMF